MSKVSERLLDVLDLEALEKNLFRGENESRGHRRLFGGQVLAQALAAAYRTVEEDRLCHSLHGYFLRPGDADRPVVYEVESIRNGRSFTTRSIKAIQNGEAIFSMDASFQVVEKGLHHQEDPPGLPEPDQLEDDIEAAIRKWGKDNPWASRKRPFEIRSIESAGPNANASWIRFRQPITDDIALQQLLLSYASDMSLISTAMIPHRAHFRKDGQKNGPHRGMQMASLDHALWFHEPFNVNNWLLYYRETPAGAGARGYTRGAFYTAERKLVASVMQEGLIRIR